jgi:uncharacterized membrane protein
MKLAAACVSTVIAYVILEATWLLIMTPLFYTSAFAQFSKEKLAVRSSLAVVLIYILIIKAFFWLVVLPIKNENLSMAQAIVRGAVFGSVVYGVYNLTNKATLLGYPWTLVVVDTAWGTVLFSLLAAVFRLAFR